VTKIDKAVLLAAGRGTRMRELTNELPKPMIIVRGQRALAEAYATHVLDIYDHFSWRWIIQSEGQTRAETMLSVVPDEWQSRYFDAKGNIKVAQLRFWLSALPAP